MRRPLKPFVTEYKGARRAAPAFGEQNSLVSERPAPKPVEARTQSQPDSDDSYEAAMRAADALFSSSSDRRAESRAEPSPAGPQADVAGFTSPERGGGRILRAIEEPPSPQFAAREAELAPKRRGRKPGSKNKPKIPALTSMNGDFAGTQITPAPVHAVDATIPRSAMPSHRPIAAAAAAAPSLRSERRFPWVRDRLKPGEYWKRRRLPKVCW